MSVAPHSTLVLTTSLIWSVTTKGYKGEEGLNFEMKKRKEGRMLVEDVFTSGSTQRCCDKGRKNGRRQLVIGQRLYQQLSTSTRIEIPES